MYLFNLISSLHHWNKLNIYKSVQYIYYLCVVDLGAYEVRLI